MEATLNIVSIIIIVFGILQIILFFKLWGMTNNVDEIKNMIELFMKKDFQNNNHLAEKNINKKSGQPISISDDIPAFTINGNDIQFADGKSGRIRTYPRDKECSIYDDKGKEIIYNDKNAAISALYIFLSTGEITEIERFNSN